MIRRIAPAVLYAVFSLIGSLGVDASAADLDDADGAFVEYAEYGDDTGRQQRGGVIGVASQACGEPIDRAWVIRRSAGASVAVAAQWNGDHIALLNVAVEPHGDAPERFVHLLLSRALGWCRDLGALKVSIEAERVPRTAVVSAAQQCGFQLSAIKQSDDGEVMEFYTNLYWTASAPRQDC